MNPFEYFSKYSNIPNLLFLLLIFGCQHYVKSELTPPYFNLAEGRHITATATCGVGSNGPELYCKLVGANMEHDTAHQVIQGQVCDYCDPARREKAHPAEYAIDGTANWWQSPPLSRGMKYNEVNLTIDFGQEFHVAYLFIRMGNSPRPGLWSLEKSSDYGKTWKAWQHFSDTPADCETFFGRESLKPITNDDDVICTTEYSKIVPLEDGEIPVMLLNNRPSANNYFNSTTLQEWTRATNVRFRFYRTKNLLGHLMSVARQDPSVTRRYFYSIKDISIGGRCMCNGHADTCDVLDHKNSTRILACQCRHNTNGIHCNECKPGFEQKKWRQNTKARPFACEPCNCHGHSAECKYDEEVDRQRLSVDIHGNYEGGGVCQNCQHNTEGINCNKCQSKYYRPYGKNWNDTDVCSRCNCETFYSTGNCAEGTGQCECKPEFQSPSCDRCSFGHFGYPDCRKCECNLNGTNGYQCEGPCACKSNFDGTFCEHCADGFYGETCSSCECDLTGSLNGVCDLSAGQCSCKPQFDGKHCDRCKDGYFDYPTCKYCNCDLEGTVAEICDKDQGVCLCKEGYGGVRCDQCSPGYYNYPNCIKCNCSTVGSVSTTCDVNGKCPCLNNFAGKQCSQCSAGYYDYPQCLPCNCESPGSNGVSCNVDGQCSCHSNFDGKTCGQCKESFYNYPACEDCNCDPAGVAAGFSGCGSVPLGELCQCKERVSGRICNECKLLYWNLNLTNPLGCDECDCFQDGTLGTLDTCNSKTGQCPCKPSVSGRVCNECKDGSFDLLGGNVFGCRDCGCDIGGSLNELCNKENGQCKCKPRITGRTCSQPITTHYFPTLHHNRFEFEDGYTPSGTHVRYEFEESIFPGFSKRGYAKFTQIQNELITEVNIITSSFYRMIIRYVNPNDENAIAEILITSDNPNEVDQKAKVLFRPTTEPQFVTVSGPKGDIPTALVLDPGRYTISVKTSKYLFLDYFVLLPAAYYEATILTRKIDNPCEIDDLALCRHFKYPSIDDYKPITRSFNADGEDANELYTDENHLQLVKSSQLPLLNNNQQSLTYITNVDHPGKYILVVDYITDRNYPDSYPLKLKLTGSDQPEGYISAQICLYTTVCRQPVIDSESREQIFVISTPGSQSLQLSGDEGSHIAISSITAIPLQEWSIDLITPSSVCVLKDGECVESPFYPAPDSKKVEFKEFYEPSDSTSNLNNRSGLVYLGPGQTSITITSKVANLGRYNILIRYFQPNHANFDILYKIESSKQMYEGSVNLGHCPSYSGCREIILQSNGARSFELEEDVVITFTNIRNKGVWVDYILFIAEGQFSDNHLQEETFDQTKEFIQNCGQNHFHIPLNASDFCKQAVFSLTSDYNSGALACNCDYEGSTSFECDPFGGQCQCKPNIIGRQCDACRTGYYGFPNCKPCDCPSKSLCEKETGACICPPHVIGEKCDKCEPYSFGFDQYFGCESCNCDAQGVEFNDLQCDLNNGSCACRPNIEGRTCDKCRNGHFRFPLCDQCRCNIDGTTNEICDQQDETCFCKKNVHGQACDRCIDGTYNLQSSNPEGCTKCFCFGKTTRCDRALLRPFNVSMINEHAASVNTILLSPVEAEVQRWPLSPLDLLVEEFVLETDFSLRKDKDELIYFGVLDRLADQTNHLTAYGGNLVYALNSTSGFNAKSLIGPDVLLESREHTIVHQSYQQPASDHVFLGSVPIIESSFTTLNGSPVTREQIMHVLKDLQAIYIRAAYWDDTTMSRLSDVELQMADDDVDDFDLLEELSVEKCHCPAGYIGNSCEDCAPGYYRDPSGPHGGYCLPCQCNNHADTCDVNTGICQNCKHSTTGDHCEKCIIGFHGNALIGSPNDCMICACPLPIESNNFATGCEISEDGYRVHCICRDGYAGEKCQSCARGYFGQPTLEGQYCQPCQCSGNIDPNEEGSCDSVTGECLKCQNNTFGTACNYCAPFYFGDAVHSKNCQSCICDKLGTNNCDRNAGTCECHPNVVGSKCDRCKEDHYGFESGQGCLACDCGVASNSTQCDDHTGECRCKPGVTGRQCDRCLPGYWNYTAEGCSPCSCNNDYSRGVGCNVLTGQCECLPGVVGEKCDSCPHRWVLIQDQGCYECDICHHDLLDVTDSLSNELGPVISDFQTVAGGFFTSQKLKYFSELADQIEPDVMSLGDNQIDLLPLTANITKLESEAKSFERTLRYANETVNDQLNALVKLMDDSRNVLVGTGKTFEDIQNTVYEVQKLADSFDVSENTKSDTAISEANEILDQLHELSVDTTPTRTHLENATLNLKGIENFISPIQKQQEKLKDLRKNIQSFNLNLEDLSDKAHESRKIGDKAKMLHAKNENSNVNAKFETANNHTKETQANLNNTIYLVKSGNITLGEIYRFLKNLENVNNELRSINTQVDRDLPSLEEEYDGLDPIIAKTANHRAQLVETANKLKSELENITGNTETPLKAANAYSDIIKGIDTMKEIIKNSTNAANNAVELTSGIDNRAGESDHTSRQLLEEARQSLSSVQVDLQPHINNSTVTVEHIKSLNELSDEKAKNINLLLDKVPNSSQSDIWENARDKAIEAQKQAEETKEILQPILKTLPNDLSNATQISKKIDDTNMDINDARDHIERVAKILPNLKSMVDTLKERQQEIGQASDNLSDRIGKLKNQIEMARDIANSIKVGVRFHPNTTLELQPPPSLAQLATNSRVSAYFRTNRPNGVLMYLGNENRADGKRGKNDDFMAIEIENGYPVLKVDFGNGSEKINSNRNVENGNWHQVIVERTGNDIKLTIREETEDGKERDHETEHTLGGNQNIFDLDSKNSRLFVGGYPPDFNPQEGLTESSFEGEVEDVRINDEEVGLWNFVDGQNNIDGAQERNQLIASKVQPTGYRFSGHGYVILDSKPYNFKQRSNIQFKFKTNRDTTDGLMFYAGKNRYFISIEMENGGIYFKYKLGQHAVSIGSDEQLNDDQWHRVAAERDGRVGILKIDGKTIYQQETPVGTEENLKISDSMYFGGYPGQINHTEVVSKKFDGCIDEVFISGTPVDLSRNMKAYGVRAGCAVKFSTILSYHPRQFGYLRHNITSSNQLQINLKFKTKQGKGIIFYATDKNQENTFSLSLENGALVLRSQNAEASTHPNIYNDSEWHFLVAKHDGEKLRLSVDDATEMLSSEASNELIFDSSDIYFGGLPKNFQVLPGVSSAYFVGCISDVLINGPIVNFAESTDRKSAVLDNCARDILDYDPFYVPIVYAEDNIEPTTTLEAEIKKQTEKQELENEARRQQEANTESDVLGQPDVDIRLGENENKNPTPDDDENRVIPQHQDYLTTSTTLRPTKRRPSKQDPICKLTPDPESDVGFNAGYRFGTVIDSRIEYAELPAKIRKSYDISLQFRTEKPNGTLFYAADSRHTDFIVLYLKDGHVYHSFNCGSGSANITSPKQYNDNIWHTVHISRNQAIGTLLIDQDTTELSGESVGNTRVMSLQAPYSFGGVNPNQMDDLIVNTGIEKGTYFSGCIKNIQVGGHSLGKPDTDVGALNCSDKVEDGVFFNGGYIKLRDRFKVGVETTISFDIKPRTLNGLLLSVHGRKAMLALQLINGTINFTVDNGGGPITAVFTPEKNQNFCDGEWHTVTAIKSKYVISLMVDKVTSLPTIGATTAISTDTTRPLFLGGHPYLSKARGLQIRRHFDGCIRNVKIKDVAEPIQLNMAVGKVRVGVCPTY